MQHLTETEINWIVDLLLSSARIKEEAIKETNNAFNELLKLKSEQFRSIADRLAKAALEGDKRIEIRR